MLLTISKLFVDHELVKQNIQDEIKEAWEAEKLDPQSPWRDYSLTSKKVTRIFQKLQWDNSCYFLNFVGNFSIYIKKYVITYYIKEAISIAQNSKQCTDANDYLVTIISDKLNEVFERNIHEEEVADIIQYESLSNKGRALRIFTRQQIWNKFLTELDAQINDNKNTKGVLYKKNNDLAEAKGIPRNIFVILKKIHRNNSIDNLRICILKQLYPNLWMLIQDTNPDTTLNSIDRIPAYDQIKFTADNSNIKIPNYTQKIATSTNHKENLKTLINRLGLFALGEQGLNDSISHDKGNILNNDINEFDTFIENTLINQGIDAEDESLNQIYRYIYDGISVVGITIAKAISKHYSPPFVPMWKVNEHFSKANASVDVKSTEQIVLQYQVEYSITPLKIPTNRLTYEGPKVPLSCDYSITLNYDSTQRKWIHSELVLNRFHIALDPPVIPVTPEDTVFSVDVEDIENHPSFVERIYALFF